MCLVIVDRSAKYLSRGFVKKEDWACSTEVFSLVLVFCWFAFLLCLWFCVPFILSHFQQDMVKVAARGISTGALCVSELAYWLWVGMGTSELVGRIWL